MAFTYTPGNIVVDEASAFGERVHLPSSETAHWPDTARWLARTRQWLDRIAATRVGNALMAAMQPRTGSAAGVVVKVVRMPRLVNEAYTDGILPASSGVNTDPSPTVFITFTPQDARSGPMDLSPMRQPGSVLAHELMHACMGVHGLNSVISSNPVQQAVATWTSAPYPNHNEFCATTIQNMLLSETGSLLADGYDPAAADDPSIVTTQTLGTGTTAFGMPATSRVDLADFVQRYRQPLEFLVSSLPGLTNTLAGLSGIAFNPFAAMRTAGSGGTPRRGGARGAARTPGPVRIGP